MFDELQAAGLVEGDRVLYMLDDRQGRAEAGETQDADGTLGENGGDSHLVGLGLEASLW